MSFFILTIVFCCQYKFAMSAMSFPQYLLFLTIIIVIIIITIIIITIIITIIINNVTFIEHFPFMLKEKPDSDFVSRSRGSQK